MSIYKRINASTLVVGEDYTDAYIKSVKNNTLSINANLTDKNGENVINYDETTNTIDFNNKTVINLSGGGGGGGGGDVYLANTNIFTAVNIFATTTQTTAIVNTGDINNTGDYYINGVDVRDGRIDTSVNHQTKGGSIQIGTGTDTLQLYQGGIVINNPVGTDGNLIFHENNGGKGSLICEHTSGNWKFTGTQTANLNLEGTGHFQKNGFQITSGDLSDGPFLNTVANSTIPLALTGQSITSGLNQVELNLLASDEYIISKGGTDVYKYITSSTNGMNVITIQNGANDYKVLDESDIPTMVAVIENSVLHFKQDVTFEGVTGARVLKLNCDDTQIIAAVGSDQTLKIGNANTDRVHSMATQYLRNVNIGINDGTEFIPGDVNINIGDTSLDILNVKATTTYENSVSMDSDITIGNSLLPTTATINSTVEFNEEQQVNSDVNISPGIEYKRGGIWLWATIVNLLTAYGKTVQLTSPLVYTSLKLFDMSETFQRFSRFSGGLFVPGGALSLNSLLNSQRGSACSVVVEFCDQNTNPGRFPDNGTVPQYHSLRGVFNICIPLTYDTNDNNTTEMNVNWSYHAILEQGGGPIPMPQIFFTTVLSGPAEISIIFPSQLNNGGNVACPVRISVNRLSALYNV